MNLTKNISSLCLIVLLFFGSLHAVHAENLTTIHIGVPTNSATWFPLYVAWKKGMFREQGLDLVPVTMQARTALAAMASKQIGFITQIGSPMTAITRGLPASLIMTLCDRSHHVLVTKAEITTPAQLRGRVVAISQPGGTVYRELLAILEKYKIDQNAVKIISLGSTPNGITALKSGTADAAILLIPHDLYLEKDGFTGLVYLKDVLEFPLAGIVAHNDQLRERPNDVKKILLGALRGIHYSKTRGDEAVPLLKQFLGLESMEMAKKAYQRMRDIWSDTGVPSEKGLRTAASLAEVPHNFPLDKLANWSYLEEARLSLKTR
ncbi:MAG TPA: ABC transporter substrate-binding protein [Candidatus Binatia bacterium]|nr:ABC transporter substrate-binding protein [Candidatus Binatia bacterium]